MMRRRPLLHVEVCLKPHSTVRHEPIRKQIQQHLRQHTKTLLCHSDYYSGSSATDCDNLNNHNSHGDHWESHVLSIRLCEVEGTDKQAHETESLDLCIHVYQWNGEDVHVSGESTDGANGDAGFTHSDMNEQEQEPASSLCHDWILPAQELHGLWESLVFEQDVPARLLRYIQTTMLFSDRQVNANIITWNRVLLLHGPPGTGKTSLCRALAQKLTIRLSPRYSHGRLVEIHSHNLFSKWFAESGKLVMKLFCKIQEMVEEEDAFVCILIDEVETLAAARKSAASGSEPQDAVRVVNALLTELDKIKRMKNVLIMTTSNIGDTIDVAFVDRADIKQYIGPPSQRAIYSILRSCILELMRVEILSPPVKIMDMHTASMYFPATRTGPPSASGGTKEKEEAVDEVGKSPTTLDPSEFLWRISAQCVGMSGRTLRKIAFLAHSMMPGGNEQVRVDTFLEALRATIAQHRLETQQMQHVTSTTGSTSSLPASLTQDPAGK